jgi:tol-pal system protein YbgF
MMKKLVLAGLVAVALCGGGGAQAMTIGNLLSGHTASNPDVVKVQAASPEVQVQQLQETVRQLTGRIEDMSYQLLQMQEQLRKTQEDNEFRFQELEKKAGGKKSSALDKPVGQPDQEAAQAAAPTAPADQTTPATMPAPSVADQTASTAPPTASSDGLPSDSLSSENQTAGDLSGGNQITSSEAANIQPGTLGSLIFNGDGQVVETTRNPADNAATTLPGVSGAATSDVGPQGQPGVANPSTETPQVQDQQQASISPDATNSAAPSSDEVYQKAYKFILGGDYVQAETAFKGYLQQFPEGEKASDASFWLGESEYSQGHYNDAAKTFLNAYKTYGTSPKAPEMLLKLGMSLAALDNKDTACATYREIPKRFPKASKTVIAKVATEQSRLACSSS